MAGVYGIFKFLEFSYLSLYVYKNILNLDKVIIFLLFLTGIVFESCLSFIQYIFQGSIGGFFYFFGERTFNAQTPGIANASINGQLYLRPYATFSHPNVLAGYLMVAMLFLFLFFPNKAYAKILTPITVFIGTFSVFITFSRAAIIIWIVYLAIIFGTSVFEKYKKATENSKFKLSLTAFIIIFLIIVGNFQNSLIWERFTQTKITDESIVQRQELTSQSLLMFYKNPIAGVGLNNFFSNINLSDLIQPVHNIFLLVLSETGLIGALGFICIFINAFLAIYKSNRKRRQYLLMIIFAIIFLGTFDHYFLTLQQGQLLFAVSIGTAFSYKNI